MRNVIREPLSTPRNGGRTIDRGPVLLSSPANSRCGTLVRVLIGWAWLGHGQRSKVHAEG